MMNTTPQSNRLTVALFGRRNAGKSTLFNAVAGQDCAIVSDTPGTTTDPVAKSMELLPFGPIVLIDTAGWDDNGPLGEARVKKTEAALNRADLAVYAIDACQSALDAYEAFAGKLSRRGVPVLPVITKGDTVSDVRLAELMRLVPGSLAVCAHDPHEVDVLKDELARRLTEKPPEPDLIGGLLPACRAWLRG